MQALVRVQAQCQQLRIALRAADQLQAHGPTCLRGLRRRSALQTSLSSWNLNCSKP